MEQMHALILVAAAAWCSQPASAFLLSSSRPTRAHALGRPAAAAVSYRHARGTLGLTSVLLAGADLAVGGRQGTARWKSLDKKREQLGSEREKQIRDVFRQIDRDNSGALSVQELQAALKEMGIYKAKEEVAMTINEIDANNSGQVDANEFVDMVLRLEHQRDIEACFERNDATYSIFWQQNGDLYQAVGQYGTEARRRALRRVRGDDKTFASESVKFEFSARGQAPMARAARTGEEVVLDCGPDGYLKGISSPQRRALAKEFGIKHIHFVPVAGGVVEYGRAAGEEVEITRLLNALMYQILHPQGVRDCVKKLGEVGQLLVMLVKLEEASALTGLSKAVVALYDAVMSYERSLERDVLAAFTYARSVEGSQSLKKDAAARGRARFLVNLITPVFAVARGIILCSRFLRALWSMRNDAVIYADKGVEQLVETGRQASTGFARNVRASLGVFGSGSTALVRSDKDDDEKPLKLPAAVKSAPARTTVGAGAGNNDEEIFVKSTAGMR